MSNKPVQNRLYIENQLLKGENVRFIFSPNFGADFKKKLPDTIIFHYTAGPSAKSAISTLTNPTTRVSTHLIISRKGEIFQLVPFDKIAWHAGKSRHNQRKGLNRFSIGIELVNAGRLIKKNENYYSWFKKKIGLNEVLQAIHKNEQNFSYWHRYTAGQICQAERVCAILKDRYNIDHILGHDEIAPKRKTDPGPAFPIDILRENLL